MANEKEFIQPEIEDIVKARLRLRNVINATPLMHNINYSDKYKANIYFKREDLQIVRSYKIRGAYNKICTLSPEQLANGIVCASAGNHAQGVAYSCNRLKIKGTIYMPSTTPNQKIKQVEMFGKQYVKTVLIGDAYDDAYNEAITFSEEHNVPFIHPFDDPKVIEGQGTVGLEIVEEFGSKIDYLFVPIGGGGLAAGVSSIVKRLSPDTIIIGVEPKGAPAMKKSIEKGEVVTLDVIDKFVDGAAVFRVGELTFKICKELLNDVATVDEGKICSTILELYNEEAIVVEPAGALTLSVLDKYKKEIKGKNVVCVISGSNNDITRTEEIKERSMLYEGLKHYFLIRFPQRSGALREFVVDILGPTDDISMFEYRKKNNKETGPALVGIVVKNPNDIVSLKQRMTERKLMFEYVNEKIDVFQFLI